MNLFTKTPNSLYVLLVGYSWMMIHDPTFPNRSRVRVRQ